ncbi:MAG TPA: hypothetical protein VD813_09700, partial [Pseudonocardia sp.]|nr:hypothetical protein [Pseudonocardia sp.]
QNAERQNAERQNAERQDAERQDAEQQDAERQNAERQNAEQQNAERQNAERQNAEQQNAEQQNAEQQNAEQQNAERQDAEQQSAERQNAERQNAERQNADQRDAERQVADRQDAEPVGAGGQDPERGDVERQRVEATDAGSREPGPQVAERNDAESRRVAANDAGSRDATRRDAERANAGQDGAASQGVEAEPTERGSDGEVVPRPVEVVADADPGVPVPVPGAVLDPVVVAAERGGEGLGPGAVALAEPAPPPDEVPDRPEGRALGWPSGERPEDATQRTTGDESPSEVVGSEAGADLPGVVPGPDPAVALQARGGPGADQDDRTERGRDDAPDTQERRADRERGDGGSGVQDGGEQRRADGGGDGAVLEEPQSLSWQGVDGSTVSNFSYDAETDVTVGESTRPNGAVQTDTFSEGGRERVIERPDGTSRVVTTNARGGTRITDYDENGEEVSSERERRGPVTAPSLPETEAPADAVPMAWTETNRRADLVTVVSDPRSGTTIATTTTPEGGESTTRWNPDGSVTGMRTTEDGRIVETSIDPRGREVSRVYRDGELVRTDRGRADTPERPTLDVEGVAGTGPTTVVTRQGERAELENLVDGGVTDSRVRVDGTRVERTFAPNGASVTVTDDNDTTTYRRVDARGRATVTKVDNETGEARERSFRGAPVPEAPELPGYARRDADPRVRESTDAAGQTVTTTKWDNGTRLVEYATPTGDQVVETRRPNGLDTTQLLEGDGDVVTRQERPNGRVELSTLHRDGASVQQRLPEELADLPVTAVEVVDTEEAFSQVEASGGSGARERVSFRWGDWDVEVRSAPGGRTTWLQEAGDDALDTLQGEDVAEDDAVDWEDWTVRRDVDRSGDLTRRTEARAGDDGDTRADGLLKVAPDGGTRSSWEAIDDDGRQLTSMRVNPDGSMVQVSELDPEFGPGYRTETRQNADGDVVTDVEWDESDIGNGVTMLRARSDADGDDAFVRYGYQGPGESAPRFVYTDVSGRFVDDRATITDEEARSAAEDGAVIVQGEQRGGRGSDEEQLLMVPDWAIMEIGDGLATPPAERFAEGTGEGGPEVPPPLPTAAPGSQAPATVARWVGGRVAEGFGAEGLAASTIANAAGGVAGVISGDPNALRNTAGAITSDVVGDLASDVFTNEWSGAAGALGTVAGKLVTGGEIDPVNDIAAPIGGGLITEAAGAAAGQVGAGLIRLGGQAIFDGEVTGEQIMNEAVATGAGLACSTAGTPAVGALCYGLGSLLLGLFGNKPEPDDLAEEFADEYEDQRHVRHNPFANMLETARNDDGAHEELWEFRDDVNLAGGMEFNPDQDGQLTRQAYLATTDPLTT